MTTNSPAEPVIAERDAQPYVAIRRTVTMQTINEAAHKIPEVLAWLGQRGIAPAGPPFLKYNLIDMERELEIEAGVPVPSAAEGGPAASGDQVLAGILPPGRYAAMTYVGDFGGLIDAVRRLLEWAAGQGLRWDKTETQEGDRWGCRLEVYKTDPSAEPDPGKWETELVFRLAG
jgi:effector-binding domain-containing protein